MKLGTLCIFLILIFHIAKAQAPSDFERKIDSLQSISLYFLAIGENELSIESFEKLIELISISNLHYSIELADAKNNLASIYTETGRYKQAFNLYNESLEIFNFHNDTSSIAMCHFNIGVLQNKMNDAENSMKSINLATDLYSSLKPFPINDIIDCLIEIFGISYQTERFYMSSKSLDLLDRVESSITDSTMLDYNVIYYLGLFCHLTNNIELAESFYMHALRTAKADETNNKDIVSDINKYMSIIKRQNGDFALAEQYCKEAIRIHEKENIKTQNKSKLADCLAFLGDIYLDLGNYKKSEECYASALNLCIKSDFDNDSTKKNIYFKASNYYLSRNDINKAEIYIDKAIAIESYYKSFDLEIFITLAEIQFLKRNYSASKATSLHNLKSYRQHMANDWKFR